MSIYSIVFTAVIISGTLCCFTPYEYGYKCLTDIPVFDRIPVEANDYHTKYCVGAYVFIQTVIDIGDEYIDFDCWINPDWQYSAPENQQEMDYAVQKTKEHLIKLNSTIQKWTLQTDGGRREECIPPKTCLPNETFYHPWHATDSQYMGTHWMKDEPDNNIYSYGTKDCLAFNQDGQFLTVFCRFGDSPFYDENGERTYTINGYYCIYAAEESRL